MAAPQQRRKKPPEIIKPYLAVDRPNEDGEWAMHCPFHEDDDPSAYVNFDKRVWVCHRGCGRGPIRQLVERLMAGRNTEPAADGDAVDEDGSVTDIEAERDRRHGESSEPLNAIGVIEAWHNQLLLKANKEHLAFFQQKRGLSLDTIRKYRIGWQPTRKLYTIPVFDRDGDPINIRYYNPRATGKQPKYRNHKGYGRMELYPQWPESALDGVGIVLCEGELDALICIQNGIPALTVTAGAGNWNSSWNGLFKGKRVWVVYDRDKAGVDGSIKVINHIRKHAAKVYNVELPFEFRTNHGEDVTDFFVEHGLSIGEFRRLLIESEPASEAPKQKREKPVPVSVVGSFASSLVGKPLEMRGTVVGHSTQPHLVPRAINYQCTLDAGDKCHKCPMMANGGEMVGTIDPDNTFILEFLNVPNNQKDNLVRELMGIVKCNRMEYSVADNHSVETLVVRSSIDHSVEEAADHTQRRVIAVGPHDTKISETIRFIGTTAPGPKDQVNEFQAWEVEKDRSAFDAFVMTPDVGKQLESFRVDSTNPHDVIWQLTHIANDLSENVTNIYERPQLHIAIDLVYHSITMFRFAGKPIDRGWLDVLVIGDTRTGKSETAAKLRAFYGMGEMLSCESVSFAGVLGGLTQKFGKDWTIVWGALPVNDRRLVILDEVAGLSIEEISQLSAVRSSGIAKIQKIESQEALARTRLLWLANPRNGKTISQHTFGVRAIKPLIGNPEDIARFDFALTVSSTDVNFSEINRVPQARGFRFPQEGYRNLILWAWSRRMDDVIFPDETVTTVMNEAGKLPDEFIESPPLIQGANIRMKLARIATAIAARLFSTDASYEKVLVLPQHVLAASIFLRRLYGHHSFGYKAESDREKAALKAADAQRSDVKVFIYGTQSLEKFLKDVPSSSFARQQLEEFLSCSREHANGVISYLAARDMVKPGENGQVTMQPVLLDLLRELK